MLAIVSDLHLQHTSDDFIRYRAPRREFVQEVGVVRNVSADALGLFFDRIRRAAVRRGSKEVHVVLAGDILEIHRSPIWLWGGRLEPRPFDMPLGPDRPSNALRETTLRVLERIETDNHEFFAALRDFVRDRKYRWVEERTAEDLETVRVHYLPGNHDRLANAWKGVREQVGRMLSLDLDPAWDAGKPFGRALEPALEKRYRVRVRHGQEYDRRNFGVVPADRPRPDFDEREYLLPSLGDYLTVDFATRLALAFRAYYAVELRTPGKAGDPYRSIYLALTEFDDVRPTERVLEFIESGSSDHELARLLQPVFRNVFEWAENDPFFKVEAARQGLGGWIGGVGGTLVEEGIKNAPELLVRLLRWLLSRVDGDEEPPARLAARERGVSSGDVVAVVGGHTHEPEQVPLPSCSAPADEPFYVNTGTWRTRVISGEGRTFGRLRSYTLVFCYDRDEAGENGRRFESWTGHLANRGYGPVGPRDTDRVWAPATQELVVTRIVVKSIDEGSGWFRSAELRLRIGVDGAADRFSRDGVHDGDEIPAEGLAFDLHPELDGELWCYGWEEDLGDSIVDKDDPLPFAVQALARTDAGAFATDEDAVLRLRDRTGTNIKIHYAVRDKAPEPPA